ncbi:ATP-binding cassette domain-containing protein [Amycolatopsis sp. YIM 10]|uniref:ATP-binding cassette domain-containing protein n=1 Tax=Amycolatopsis sp. YIM 10 TaxID=2653857 RepID=UPI00129067DB|nr:ATP-binding cassette domain-containing protein [Amycolatopsis sp. YIM 10]QFU91733.1 Daunorubicin/doxorubicin resistance ATP-binding protein DrrA [Amycolatopsis sp. YIM 10]
MSVAIRAEGLVKRFGKTTALAGIHLSVPHGEVAGVLGPNGAGKTTAVRILATLSRPDAGQAFVCGHDVRWAPGRVRELIGLTGQYASVDDDLTGTQNLVLVGRLLGMSGATARARAAELLERFELEPAAGRVARTYSGGLRRRLDLAASLVGRPRVLFLDEPTTGLDPHARNEVWRMVRGLAAEGTTVLLTTQYLEEADRLTDQLTVIDHGRVVAAGHADDLKRRVGGQSLRVRPTQLADLSTVAGILAGITGSPPAEDPDTGVLTAPVADPMQLATLVRMLDRAGITAAEIALRLPSLDEVFLALTGKPAGVPEREESPA